MWLHATARILVGFTAVLVMAVTTMEIWANGQGEIERFFWQIHNWVYQHELNWLERTLGYNKRGDEPDYILFVAGLVAFLGAKSFGSFLAGTVILFGSGLIGNRVDITISPSHLVVHRRWWRDLKLTRDVDSLQVRVVPPEEYYSQHSLSALQESGFLVNRITHPPAVVEIAHSYRRYKVIMARRADEAEAIVVRCNEALMATNPAFSFATS